MPLRFFFLCALPLSLSVILFPCSVNAADNFTAATPLSGILATSTESNQNATKEAGEPALASTTFRSVWWKWTAPSNGRVTVETIGSDTVPTPANGSTFGKFLAVYISKMAPAQINSLALVHTEGCQTCVTPAVTFPVAAGTEYFISVASEASGEYGNIRVTVSLDTNTDVNQLNVQTHGLISNDFFANRAVLTGPLASSIAYNNSATNEPAANEPVIGFRTMWWTWTAPETGRVTISTTGSDELDGGSPFGKTLAVFLGSALPNLSWVDAVSGQTLSTPQLTIPVTRGQTYQISLGSEASAEGGSLVLTLNLNSGSDINALNIKTAATAANDLFANRTVLSGTTVSAISYGLAAGIEPLEPAAAGGKTLWWTWTAPASGTVSISTTESSGAGSNRTLAVWTGTTLDPSRVPVASVNNVQTPSLTFTAAAGQAYQISVGNNGSTAAVGTVVLTLSGPPGPAAAQVPGLEITGAVRLKWFAANGVSYRVQSSNDLTNWQNAGAAIPGDGTFKESFQAVTPGAKYFRVFTQ